MSNCNWNNQTANMRGGSGKKIGKYGRGQNNIPTPTKMEKDKSFTIPTGDVSGTAKGMGAATKGGKYHWVGPNKTDW